MTTITQGLPEYENPPVTEVACGVLFRSIDTLLAPHLGLLWDHFRSEYPTCQEVAPLLPVIEGFGETRQLFELPVTDVPPLPRIWFIDASENSIIQVQRDRFHYNWRKVRSEDEYPRYHKVIGTLRERLLQFQSFLSDAGLGTIEPLQYEMTYVNQIPQGSNWTTMADIGNVFPDLSWRARQPRFLSEAEGINWRTAFVLPEQVARLHIAIRCVIRPEDSLPVLLFELTSRGIGGDRSLEKIWDWFDLSREWIVRGFTDLTSQEVQEKVWGRIR